MALLLLITKYVPLLHALLLSVHCLLLLFDIDLMVIRVICQVPPMFLFILLILNHIFKLCLEHKLLVIYCFIVNLCIIAERCDWFEAIGIPTDYARLAMLIVGVALILDVSIKFLYYGTNSRSEAAAQCHKAIRRTCKR